MRHLLRLLLLVAACFSLARPAQAAEAPDTLILISIDGFRSDYLTHGKTPTLAALAAQGVQAPMRPSYPSQTFPNHYTLVTGLRPDHHGIVDNTMEDPVLGRFTMENSKDSRWWDEGEPVVTQDYMVVRGVLVKLCQVGVGVQVFPAFRHFSVCLSVWFETVMMYC